MTEATFLDESGQPMLAVPVIEWGCVEALRAALNNLNTHAITPAECTHGVGTVQTRLGAYDVAVVLRRVQS